jgi:hypothetical protein
MSQGIELVKKKEVSMDKKVELNEDTHEYRVDGVRYKSVSELISPIKRIFGSEESAVRGRNLHDAVEVYLKTGLKNCEEDALPFFESFCAEWERLDKGYTILAVEEPIAHPFLGFAGKPDIVIKWGAMIDIIDVKSTATINWALVIPQLSAYWKIMVEKYPKTSIRLRVLHVTEKSARFVDVPVNDNIVWCLLGINQFIKECEKL